jgi:hypothetical protein
MPVRGVAHRRRGRQVRSRKSARIWTAMPRQRAVGARPIGQPLRATSRGICARPARRLARRGAGKPAKADSSLRPIPGAPFRRYAAAPASA